MCGVTVVRMGVRTRARRSTPRTEHVRNLSRFTDFMDAHMAHSGTYLHSSSLPISIRRFRSERGIAGVNIQILKMEMERLDILPLHLRFDSAIRQHLLRSWVPRPAPGCRILDVCVLVVR